MKKVGLFVKKNTYKYYGISFTQIKQTLLKRDSFFVSVIRVRKEYFLYALRITYNK
jgi:hypothetical protein